jgi:hypothetical protein
METPECNARIIDPGSIRQPRAFTGGARHLVANVTAWGREGHARPFCAFFKTAICPA